MKRTTFAEKELRVIRLRAKGYRSAQIARKLDVPKADISHILRGASRKITSFQDSISVVKSLGMITGGSSATLSQLGAVLQRARKESLDQTVYLMPEAPKREKIDTLGNYSQVQGDATSLAYESKKMKQVVPEVGIKYLVNLTEIEGNGAFSCPVCKTIINPEDMTEESYEIIETVIKDDELAELVLACRECGTRIKLVGFLTSSEDPLKSGMKSKQGQYEMELKGSDSRESFHCPKCEAAITPKNITGKVYKMLLEEAKEDRASDLYLICSNCGSRIKLTGFADYILARLTRRKS